MSFSSHLHTSELRRQHTHACVIMLVYFLLLIIPTPLTKHSAPATKNNTNKNSSNAKQSKKNGTLETNNNSHPTNVCTSHFRRCSFLSTTSVSVFSLSMCHPSSNNRSGGFHSRLRKDIGALGVRGLRHNTVTTAQSKEGAASSAYNYMQWDFIN